MIFEENIPRRKRSMVKTVFNYLKYYSIFSIDHFKYASNVDFRAFYLYHATHLLFVLVFFV